MPIIRKERPPFLTVYKEDGYWILDCEDGTILRRENWLELRAQVDAFYAKYSDDEIDGHNREWLETQPVQPLAMPQLPTPGYVYLIHEAGTPWYKIGISKQPLKRAKQLGARSPYPQHLLHCFEVDDMLGIEMALHTHFAQKRGHGEWFALDTNDVLMVAKLNCRTKAELVAVLSA